MPTDCDSALAATDPELYARCPNIKRVLAGGNPVGNPVVNVAGLMAKLAMSHPGKEQHGECEVAKRTPYGNVQVIQFTIVAKAKYPDVK